MGFSYEQDKLQCTGKTNKGTRCTRIGTQAKNVQQCVAEGRHKTPFRKEAAL